MGKARPRQKGYRQGYLKQFHGEYINAGKKANSAYLQEAYRRTQSISAGESLPVEPKRVEYKSVLKQDPIDVVLGTLKELWQTDFWQGVTEFKRINIILSEGRNLFLFFAQERFFFVSEMWTPMFTEQANHHQNFYQVRRSIIYPSRAIAYLHYRHQKICWVEERDLRSPLLDKVSGPKLDMEILNRSSSG